MSAAPAADFFRPASLEDALALRAAHHATPLAGGTDLLVRHRSWTGTLPRLEGAVLYIGQLDELRSLSVSGTRMTVGAAVPYAQLLADPRVPRLLARAMEELAAPGLRSVATLVGNICNASPAADAVCALYALDAEVECRSSSGSRRVPIAEFVTGPGRTTLGDDELVTAVNFSLPQEDRVFYHKVGTRRANALSKLSVCAWADLDGVGETVTAVGLAVGAVAPTVVRVSAAEALLTGVPVADLAARRADVRAALEPFFTPISDQRSTAEYRRAAALGLVERFVGSI